VKKLVIIAALLATVSFAHAQDAAKPPETPTDAPNQAQAPVVDPKPTVAPTKFYLELDQNDINALNAVIQELPKRIADPFILKINGQLAVQARIAADYTAAVTGKSAPKIKGQK